MWRARGRPWRGAAASLALLGAAQACGGQQGAGAADGGVSEPAAAAASAAAPAVDDLLLITVDTLRHDALGFAGNERVATPHLDRLAAAGRVYTRAHAHNVVTLPSHANILTGLYPYQHGVRDNQGFRLPASVPTLATLLSEAGFATAAFVGAFPLDARFGLDRGFEVYDDRLEGDEGAASGRPLERRGDLVVAAAREWWAANADRRRFLWIHLFDPHAPYEPPAELAARYPTEPYLGEVAAVDGYLAPLLEPFLDGGQRPALIAFTADHGEALGDHGELTHGLFAYESTLKVPLVLWAPDLSPARVDAPARHVDLLPTLLAAAAVPVPEGLPGRSLLGAPAEPGGSTYFEALTATLDRGWAPLRGVVAEGHKYIDLPLPELYDLATDPGETRNVVAAEAARAEELAARLVPESVWPPRRGAVAAEEEAALRSLGYLGGGAASKATYTAADDPKNLVTLDREVHRIIELHQLGRLEEAAALGREVLAARPDMGVASYQLALVLLDAGRRDEALAVMSAAQRRGSATPALVRQLALTLAEAGRPEDAVGLMRRAAERGDVDDLLTLGLVLSEAGRQEEAAGVLQQVFAADARNAVALQHLALVALRRQDWAGALRRAEEALALNEGLGLAWSYLGSARFQLGRVEEALEAWERAVAIDPRDFDALYNIGLVAPRVDRPELAREALERFLREAPRDRYAADLEEVRRLLAALGAEPPA